MNKVTAKKHLGQHFLTDLSIAGAIAQSIPSTPAQVLEIGPGMGVLTTFLMERAELDLKVIEIDAESVDYLMQNFPALEGRIISGDFLRLSPDIFFGGSFSIIGNFPYNISSQIFFRILEYKDRVPSVVCMLQKEVAQRLASPPGNKDYGILSVLLQAYYDIEYLFTVNENVFSPPPKVKSGVIRLTRNGVTNLGCDEALFKTIIKATFNQRRKTIWNSVRAVSFNHEALREHPLMKKRPEQLSVADFVELTLRVEENR
jgi:16S rRNA (adenine1518-N6/adenine1519-N6)-dimethyltransferase